MGANTLKMHGPKPPAAVGRGFMPHKNLLALALARARVSPLVCPLSPSKLLPPPPPPMADLSAGWSGLQPSAEFLESTT
ncbi:unnamed protein product [Prunus armeniaca]|uniref:Uncharacterized protein n=1 Tax=Prunus armeniaca TaxID=36596 RepID=A0A6J5WQV6_PRUAR|nr:unnamed protein product [Prunus armeniaca]